jgi:ribonuclease BN (tRNA processing enzyme)
MTASLFFAGSGDAFGSGGRLQTCMLVQGERFGDFLLDCGSTAMIGFRRFSLDPNAVKNIFITHLHGDHFGGLPFFILDAQLVSKREAPLRIFLPEGGAQTLETTMEALFPGSFHSKKKFQIELLEMKPGEKYKADGVSVTPFPVLHGALKALALRFECGERILAYSGDTEWVEELVECAVGADLFVAEGYAYGKKIKFHLDIADIEKNAGRIGAKNYLLTHLARNTLALSEEERLPYDAAYDGMRVGF